MRRLFLNRSEPAKKSGQNIPKNRCRTTIAERMMETLAELPLTGDQVVCLSHEPGRPQQNAIPNDGASGDYRAALAHFETAMSLYRPDEHRDSALYYGQDIGCRCRDPEKSLSDNRS
jgi:hypothetical protein